MKHQLLLAALGAALILESAQLYRLETREKSRVPVRVNLIYQGGCESQDSNEGEDQIPEGPQLLQAVLKRGQ